MTDTDDLQGAIAAARARVPDTPTHRRYMTRALELARLAAGRTSPNPMVGCVLVKDGGVVAEGYHTGYGQPHAEVEALRHLVAPEHARGATAYVTLEPCCHHGKTPPCTDALLAAGIAAVHAATVDPYEQVAGRGVAQLVAAGVPVSVGLLERQAIQLNSSYLMQRRHNRPFVTAKWAMTLDGRIAATSGDSQWVSNETSLRVVHELRAQSDAILVGIGTVLRDNPRLNVRLPNYTGRQPKRVVIDTRLRTPYKARIVRQDLEGGSGEAILVASTLAHKSTIERFRSMEGVTVIIMEEDHGLMNMEAVLQALSDHGVQSLFVEGGGQLHGSMMRQGLIDEVVAFIAPKIVGGKGSANPIEGYGREFMRDALRLVEVELCAYGTDLRLSGYVRKPNALEGLYDENVEAPLRMRHVDMSSPSWR